jgi:hypothetical protein
MKIIAVDTLNGEIVRERLIAENVANDYVVQIVDNLNALYKKCWIINNLSGTMDFLAVPDSYSLCKECDVMDNQPLIINYGTL